MPKDWATCTFDADITVAQIQYKLSISYLPDSDDARLLIPVHAYEYEDHFQQKGAQMARSSDSDNYRVTSAYFDGRNPVDLSYDPSWGRGRLTIDSDSMSAWFKPSGGSWTRTGHRDSVDRDYFVELDTMTEIQWDNEMDLPPVEKGEVATQWRWVRDTDGNWYRPADVLDLRSGSNNDGEYAQIDYLVDQDDGTYYFFHYTDT